MFSSNSWGIEVMLFGMDCGMRRWLYKEKAELFVAAHEDKNVSRNESDGYPKTDHKYMDLNNKAGRVKYMKVSEDGMTDIIY